MKLSKSRLKQLIAEELQFLKESPWLDKSSPVNRTPNWAAPKEGEKDWGGTTASGGVPPGADAPTKRFERLFAPGAPGDEFAEAVAKSMMLDDQLVFDRMKTVIAEALEAWYIEHRRKINSGEPY